MAQTLTIRYFAAARAAAGLPAETLEIAQPVDKDALFGLLVDRHPDPRPGEPALHTVLAQASCLVDGLTLRPGQTVEPGQTVDVLPPFAGG